MSDSVELRRPDLAELRALWEAATPGPWMVAEPPEIGGIPTPPSDKEAGMRIVRRAVSGGDPQTFIKPLARQEDRGWVVNLLNLPADAALIVAMHGALPGLLEACEKALWALEIAKYRLDGCMAYPGEPNSITEATTLLKSLNPDVPGSLVEPTPDK